MNRAVFGFLTLSSLIASSALAESLLPRREMARLAGGVASQGYTATVSNYGNVEIKFAGKKKPVKVELDLADLTAYTKWAKALAGVQVKKTPNPHPCMHVMAPEEINLSVSPLESPNLFSGKPKLVLSGEDCSFRTFTAPVASQAHSEARAFRNAFEKLVKANRP
jgi:hypothetical protein